MIKINSNSCFKGGSDSSLENICRPWGGGKGNK